MHDLNDMRIFAKVAELQGISAAARALKIPKSRVSRRMAELEDLLGIRLLERSTRSVHLTEAGEIYARHCLQVVEESDNALHAVSQLSAAPRGLLRVSTTSSLASHLLAPLLAEFVTLYPDIRIEIQASNRRADLIAEGFDVVLRVGNLQDSSLMSRKMMSSYAALYASPEYIKRYGQPNNLEALSAHRLLVMSDYAQGRHWVLEDAQKNQVDIELESVISMNEFSALATAAEHGAGIVLLPCYIAESLMASGAIQRILPQWRSPEIECYALYPSRRSMTPKTRVWIEFLAERLPNVV